MFKILLPTDFSGNALNAINYAIYLFEKEACTFFLLHAHYLVPSGSGNKSDAKKKLQTIIKKLKEAKNPQHRFEGMVTTNTALGAIRETVSKKDIDYLFMGTKGSSAVREIFMGSVTVSVINQINNCPILAVPGQYVYDLPDEILFASDFKHLFKPAELLPLINLSLLWNSVVNVVHIHLGQEMDDFQKRNKALLKNSLQQTKHQFLEVEKQDSIADTLLHLRQEHENIGMLALLKRKHSFLEKLLREPVIRKVAFKTEVPLLVLPAIHES